MAIKRRSGSSQSDIVNIRFRSGPSWVTPANVYRRQGAAWAKVWPVSVPLSGAMSPNSLTHHNTQTTQSTITMSSSAVLSGGSGSYSIVSVSSSNLRATVSRSGLVVTVSATGRNTEISGTVTVIATDGSTNITLTLEFFFFFGVLT